MYYLWFYNLLGKYTDLLRVSQLSFTHWVLDTSTEWLPLTWPTGIDNGLGEVSYTKSLLHSCDELC